MTRAPWTESLVDPLASQLRGREWERVENARGGRGWHLLSRDGGPESVAWFHIDAHGALRPISVLADGRLPRAHTLTGEWLAEGRSVQLLAYKPGRRALFLLSRDGDRSVAKIYRKDRDVRARWTLFAGRAANPASDPVPGRWRTPRVREWDPAQLLLVTDHCPGTSLNRRWFEGDGQPSDGDRIADLWEWIIETPIPDGFPRHDSREESRVLQERLPMFQEVLRDPPFRAVTLLHRVVEGIAGDPSREWVSGHRDFHDKQILLDGDRGSLIDLDLAAAVPPGLDPGNILAHLRLRHLKGAALPWTEIAGRFATRALSRCGSDSLHRWTAATLMRLALIYSRRRRTPDLIDNLLDSTEQALERTGEWRGIL